MASGGTDLTYNDLLTAGLEARGFNDSIKTTLCYHFIKGNCSLGANCNFAHGKHELRAQVGGPDRPPAAPPSGSHVKLKLCHHFQRWVAGAPVRASLRACMRVVTVRMMTGAGLCSVVALSPLSPPPCPPFPSLSILRARARVRAHLSLSFCLSGGTVRLERPATLRMDRMISGSPPQTPPLASSPSACVRACPAPRCQLRDCAITC